MRMECMKHVFFNFISDQLNPGRSSGPSAVRLAMRRTSSDVNIARLKVYTPLSSIKKFMQKNAKKNTQKMQNKTQKKEKNAKKSKNANKCKNACSV